jgi:signal peptide peptidase SppA
MNLNANTIPFSLSMADMLWMGNQQSIFDIQNRLRLLQQGILPQHMMMPMDQMDPEDDEEEDPDTPRTRYVDLKGPLAIITTQGSLTNQDSFMNWLMGGTTYNQVRSSFLEAAALVQNGHAKEILHIVKSPGGSAQGVEDTAALIRQIATDVCPVSTYAQEACSAAYWIAAAGSKIYAASSSNLGSIGTRMSIPNVFKALQDEGVTVHTLSAGKYKSMGDPTQPWTKDAEEYLQSRVESINAVFLRTVSEYRNQPLAYVEEKMAQGREFTGEQAYDVHLIDRVVTLDKLVQQMQASLSKRTPQTSY